MDTESELFPSAGNAAPALSCPRSPLSSPLWKEGAGVSYVLFAGSHTGQLFSWLSYQPAAQAASEKCLLL